MDRKTSVGFSFGRFQPFHIGHLEYLSESFKHSDNLLIGITNPDPSLVKYHPDSEHRSLASSNPFTYYERFLMVRDSLLNEGYNRNQFEIIPFPINFPEKFKFYIPEPDFLTVYISICEKWGNTKLKIFQDMNYSVKILFNKTEDEKLTSGVKIRDYIRNNQEWGHLVTKSVKDFILINKLDERIKEMTL